MNEALVAELHELRLVARKQLPNVADLYYEATNITHTSAFYQSSVFRGDDSVKAAWMDVRDRLQEVLGETASNLYDVAIALDELTTAMGKTDRHNARQVLAAKERLEPTQPRDRTNPAHSPDPRKPGDPVNSVKTVTTIGPMGLAIERETPIP